MAKKMTKEQQMAVEIVDRAIVVSANAGSGKTSTMIERLVTLINEHKCSVSEILALTFTRSASMEMKQRMFVALQNSEVLTEEEKQNELSELNVADICSLDSFCQKIIKKYFYVKGIDPNFGVIDEVEAGYLKATALSDTLTEFSESQELLEFAQMMGATKNLNKISELILKFSEFLFTLKDPLEFLAEQNGNSAKQYNLVVHYALDKFKTTVLSLKVALSDAIKEIIMNGWDGLLECVQAAYNYCDLFKTFKLDEVALLKNIPVFPKLPSTSKGKTEEELAYKKEMTALINTVTARLKEFSYIFCFGNANELALRYDRSLVYVKTLCRLTASYINNYAKLKSARNVLDFTDLEDKAIEILRDANVGSETRNKYKYVCVDEFQDTNEKQSELLSLICGENNTFFVGDPKQSIYKFRQCDLNIFVELIEKFKKDKNKLFIPFNQNFRSHKLILSFVNKVFNGVMTKDVANIDYKGENQFSNLRVLRFKLGGDLKRVSPRKVQHIDRVRTYYLVKCDEKVRFETEIALKAHKRLNAAVQSGVACRCFKTRVASDVYSVVNESKSGAITKTIDEGDVAVSYITEFFEKKIRITDPQTRKKRRVRFSDFVILLRDRKLFKSYIAKLNEAGIPVSAKFKLNLIKESCVMNLINILRTISNPNQDLPLAATLKIIGRFSEREMLEIRSRYTADYFYLAYQMALADVEGGLSFRPRLVDFEKTIEKYRFLAQNFSVSQLLSCIINDCGLKNYFLSLENGVDKLKQVELFLAKLSGKSFENSVDEFLHFIDSYEDAFKVDYSTVSSDNCVKITTIHDSKGLEYPITIVGGCGSSFNISKTAEIGYTKELGVACQDFDLVKRTKMPSIAHYSVFMNKKNDELLEEMRVYYVALTRPKEYLMLVGVAPKEGEGEKVWSKLDCKSFYEFMTFMEK